MHIGIEGTISEELIVDALVIGGFELGLKEDGGHMMGAVILSLILHIP